MARSCPLCNASEYQIIQEIKSRDINYLIGKCTDCNFVYVTNPCADTTYDNQNADISETLIPPPKKRHFQIKRLIDNYYRHAPKIEVIEVGSGYGALAQMLSKDSRYSYLGFEPSAVRVKVCQNYGLYVKNAFFSLDIVDRLVDVIVIDNVLEHVLEPRKLIETASKALKDKGLLIVIVPNFHDVRKFKTSWREKHFWQPRAHINYFTKSHLKQVFQEYNLSFQAFNLSTLDLKTDWIFLPKVLLDSINIYRLGLYCYGIKSNLK